LEVAVCWAVCGITINAWLLNLKTDLAETNGKQADDHHGQYRSD
jgi:hypothetical protein